ncbi:MAG: MFS transporter [Waddliaceae bacterium]|nr:MFS transporter [Waddliaceae bacterium]
MKKIFQLPYLLILAVIAASIEIELSVPSFPDMVRHFGSTEETIQRTLSLNFFGFCVSSLFYGPISESFGRRPVFLFGNILFLFGSVACIFAGSIELLIAFRFFQGLGASAIWVVTFAIIADNYQGSESMKVIGLINSIITGFMAGAPILGGIINEHFGWWANYIFIGFLSFTALLLVYFFLPETLKIKKPLETKTIKKDYWTLCTSPHFLLLNTLPNVMAAVYMSYVAISPFYYIDQLTYTSSAFAFHQGTLVASFSLTSYLSARIVKKFGERRSIITGAALTLSSTFGFLFIVHFLPNTAFLISLSMITWAIGCALYFSIIFAKSLEIHPELKGPASAFAMSSRTLICAIFVTFSGIIYDGSLQPFSYFMMTVVSLAIALVPKILPKSKPIYPQTNTQAT